jgi:hypothetical protein
MSAYCLGHLPISSWGSGRASPGWILPAVSELRWQSSTPEPPRRRSRRWVKWVENFTAIALVAGIFVAAAAGRFLQGDVLPFLVGQLSPHPLWQVTLLAWLIPGAMLHLGAVGWLVARRRLRVGGCFIWAGVALLPVMIFLMFSCFAKYQFLAPASFKVAERSPVAMAWQTGLTAGALTPTLWWLAMMGTSWLWLRCRGQRVAFQNVHKRWRPGRGTYVAMSLVGASWMGLVLAITI